jgi:DNA-binding NtrC family response regulator
MVHVAAATALIACSATMIKVVSLAARLAPLPRPILLIGETGVGKRLLARLIHSESGRAGNLSVAAGSELGDRAEGLHDALERARGGTLLLDQLPFCSRAVQSTILRVLEEGENRAGAGHRDGPPAYRLIVASDRPLEDLAADGRVLADFRWWIGQFLIAVPPLRERAGDIAALSYHFLECARQEFSATGPTLFEPKALNRLLTYPWPGNIPQLRGVVERSWVRAVAGNVERIGVTELPSDALADGDRVALNVAARRDLSLWAFERAGHDRKRAAELLGVHPNTIANHRRASTRERGPALL